MKVDGLGVILAIILLPIILVVTYYIQLQVDTIAKENSYNTKLLSATYDAMSAFEINTANEELSTVADSMRSMILASNNVFLNSLATNLGISNANKEHLQQYIPAVLYTMYDGYYIYAPTETPVVAEKKEEDPNGLITTKGYQSVGNTDITDSEIEDVNNGIYGDIIYESDSEKIPQKYTIHKKNAKTNTDYILKSYVQYSARYINNDNATKKIDVTINYTLDNYLNIVGTIGDVYYTKTGYLIKNGLVTDVNIDEDDFANKNEDEARDKILGVKTNSDVTTSKAAENASIKVNGIEITANRGDIENALQSLGYGNLNIKTISETETYLEKAYQDYEKIQQDSNLTNEEKVQKLNDTLTNIQILEYEIDNYKAIAYYVSSSIFSNWVYGNLGSLKYGDIQNDVMKEYYEQNTSNYQATSKADDFYYDFSNSAVSGRNIFTQGQNPETTDSDFNTHKMEVIKNSIKYNLNLSISAYSNMKGSKDFSLPILLDEEWDKILQNISIVSFMQGLDCGLRIYNNYEIVSSTNNELTVTPSEIYYVKKEEFNNTGGTFHRIDCPELGENVEYISFKSKEVKYDSIYKDETYYYDHRNLACYRCINTNNYYEERCILRNAEDKEESFTSYYEMINLLTKTNQNRQGEVAKSENKKRAGYVSIAKERQNIYKTNALPVSEGYEIIYSSDISQTNNATLNLGKNYEPIKKLQITFSSIASANTSGNREPVLSLQAKFNDNVNADYLRNIDLNLDQSKEQTVILDVSNIDMISKIELSKTAPGYEVSYVVKSIKAIYK